MQGFFAPAAEGGLGYNLPTGGRRVLVDTRQCWTDVLHKCNAAAKSTPAATIIHLKAPTGAKAVVINITTVDATFASAFVSAGRCSDVSAGCPPFSNVNAVIGTRSGQRGDRAGRYRRHILRIRVDPMHVIIDLMGTFGTTGLRFLAITPVRVHDSRAPG